MEAEERGKKTPDRPSPPHPEFNLVPLDPPPSMSAGRKRDDTADGEVPLVSTACDTASSEPRERRALVFQFLCKWFQ